MAPRIAAASVFLFVVSIPFVGQALEIGVALTPSHLLGFVIIGLAAATWLIRRPLLPVDLAVASAAAFVLVGTATVVRVQFEPNFEIIGESLHVKSLKQLLGLAFGTAVFLSLMCVLRWCGLALSALRTHYWTTAAFAVFTLAQYAIAVADMTSPLANFPVQNSTLGGLRRLSLMYGFPRVSLTLVEPSTLATYLLSGWALWLCSFERPFVDTPSARRWFAASGVVLTVAVIVTGSRMAYVVMALLAAVAFLVRPHRMRRIGVVSAGVIVGLLLTGPNHGRALVATLVPKRVQSAAAAFLPSIGAAIAERWTTGRNTGGSAAGSAADSSAGSTDDAWAEDEDAIDRMASAVATQDISVQQRMAAYLVARDVLEERPLLGTGFGTSGFYMERYWPSTFAPLPVERVSAATMTSHYAAVATETGLLGVACLVTFAAALVLRLRRLAQRGPDHAVLAWALGASIAGYSVSALATSLVVYQILLVWLVPAIVLSLPVSDSEELAQATTTRAA